MLRASKALASVEILACDFEESLDRAEKGDWVFLDPPYVPLGGWADFQALHARAVREADHQRLHQAMVRASERGVFVTHTGPAKLRSSKTYLRGNSTFTAWLPGATLTFVFQPQESGPRRTGYSLSAAQTSLFDAAAQCGINRFT